MSSDPLCAFIGHKLTDHMKGTVDLVMRKFVKEDYHKTVAKRLCLEPEEVKEILVVAAALHDIGKAARIYQCRFSHDCEEIASTFRSKNRCMKSFYMHEILSSGSAWAYAMKRGWIKNDVLSGRWKTFLLIFSILNHMHSMRDYGDLLDICSSAYGGKGCGDKIYREILKELHIDKNEKMLQPVGVELLSQELVKYIGEWGFNIESSREIILASADRDMISKAIDFVNNFLSGESISIHSRTLEINCGERRTRRSLWKLYTLIQAPLVVADICDSFEKRSKDRENKHRRAFINELCYSW
ncbi:MAG: hypothetical protein LM581_06460 [Desulfurococcales archaeon]|nr:hypothetical protein [Desulfurococcales archaeon]